MNAKLYALVALVAMAALPTNTSALYLNTTCPLDNLDGLGETTVMLPVNETATDSVGRAGTVTLKCGGGGRESEGNPGGPRDPQEILRRWEEFIRETAERGIGEPIGNVGGGVSSCHFTNTVCAMAAADSHIEDIRNAPDLAVMLTMGGGHSNSPFGGTADIRTSLGSGTCDFPAHSGCFLNWGDLRHGGNCERTWAESHVLAVLPAAAFTEDAVCEKI